MRNALTAVSAAALCCALSACSSVAGSAAVAGDQDALVASGATNCVPHDPGSTVVRAEYDCDGGLTLTTYKSPLLRAAMASVTGDSGAGRVVRQADNWMLTADTEPAPTAAP